MVRAGDDLIIQPDQCLSAVSLLSFFRWNLPEKPNAYRELGLEPWSAHPAQGLAYSKCSVNRVSFAI